MEAYHAFGHLCQLLILDLLLFLFFNPLGEAQASLVEFAAIIADKALGGLLPGRAAAGAADEGGMGVGVNVVGFGLGRSLCGRGHYIPAVWGAGHLASGRLHAVVLLSLDEVVAPVNAVQVLKQGLVHQDEVFVHLQLVCLPVIEDHFVDAFVVDVVGGVRVAP